MNKRSHISTKLPIRCLLFLAWIVAATSLLANSYEYNELNQLVRVTYDNGNSVLYAYDPAGNLVNVVRVVSGVSPADMDNDGLPDSWEIRYFGNLAQGPSDDYNHDGITNLQHYQQGTNPADPDTDHDGLLNWQEQLAGTNPTNAASCLKVTASLRSGPGTGPLLVLNWPSQPGKTYRVVQAFDPLSPYVSVRTNLTATPPLNSWTNALSAESTLFYRVVVESP